MMNAFFLLFLTVILPLNEKESISFLRISLDKEISLGDLERCENDLRQYDDALAIGYLGVIDMLKSKHYKFPTKKYKYFSSGSKQIDAAIALSEQNVELRYLRFIFQTELPSFLGYNDNREEDLDFIVSHFDSCNYNEDYKRLMMKRLRSLSGLNEGEKTVLMKIKF